MRGENKMMKKRFSTKLLAFLVAAVTVIPTTAFAADAANQTAKQGIDPAILLTSEEAKTSEAATPPVTADEGQPTEVTAPTETAGPSAPVVSEPAVDPQAPTPDGQTVTDEQPAGESPAPPVPEEPAPVTEPVTPAEPATEIPAVPTPEEPVVTTTAPAVTVEEATPAAIEVVPVEATLTITHRLIVGEQQDDMIQTVEGLTVGQTVNLADYVVNADNVVCISNPAEITIDEESDSVVIEYNIIDVKTNSDTLEAR